jgi:hypothetical protein
MKLLSLALCLGLAGTATHAADYTPAMQSYLESEILTWAADPIILDAIRSQNAVTAGYDQAQIDALDSTWRAEVGTSSMPTISPVLTSAAAEFLRGKVAASDGTITEVFLMDAKGLNVAVSDTTSDYWQGDEDKFTMTFPRGAGAVHLGEVELDESSQRYQGQVSLTISDPATGEVLGAMTVGLDAESLM